MSPANWLLGTSPLYMTHGTTLMKFICAQIFTLENKNNILLQNMIRKTKTYMKRMKYNTLMQCIIYNTIGNG